MPQGAARTPLAVAVASALHPTLCRSVALFFHSRTHAARTMLVLALALLLLALVGVGASPGHNSSSGSSVCLSVLPATKLDSCSGALERELLRCGT